MFIHIYLSHIMYAYWNSMKLKMRIVTPSYVKAVQINWLIEILYDSVIYARVNIKDGGMLRLRQAITKWKRKTWQGVRFRMNEIKVSLLVCTLYLIFFIAVLVFCTSRCKLVVRRIWKDDKWEHKRRTKRKKKNKIQNLN